MSKFQEMISKASDKSFDAIYRAVIEEKEKREFASLDSMPTPTSEVVEHLDGKNFFDAYKDYAEINGCSLTLAKAVVDRWRKKLG